MPYIGNSPATGENNSFKILDDIKTYTLTFDGSSSSVVSVGNDTITSNNHRFITAQRVTYTDGTGTAIGGLTDGTVYFIIKNDQNTIKLATSQANANAGTAINLTALGTGTNHTLNVAFDGVNTKFKATYDNGTKALVTRAAQLTLSVNGVIQEPQDTTTPTNGFGIDTDGVIIFSVAPVNTDTFWGNLVANNFPTFDISDNTIDNFVGTGSTTVFILSKAPANNQNILVTLDGVVQYPSDATTTRSYSVTGNTLTFDTAPGNGVDIQVRHIGFAGATSSAVTGFYGRTGNVGLTTADIVTVGSIGIGTTNPTHKLHVVGDARITGILTIGTGSITLDGSNNQLKVGTGVTITTGGITGITSINSGQLGGSRNVIINGAMVVNQRGFTGSSGATANGAYTTDRFAIGHSMDGAVSAGQTTMNSTVGGNAYADGFNSALHYRVTTTDASLAAGQYALIAQPIEGFNLQGFKKGTANAQQFTLSFWVRSSLTGTYIAELYDNDNNRTVSKSYTIDTANTWEKKTLTYPADTTGVFDNDNGLSLSLNWWLAGGSTYSGGTLGTTWHTTNANRAAGQVNFLATVGNDFFLTGVQLEVGPTATEFERRSIPQELALCQRYFYSTTTNGSNHSSVNQKTNTSGNFGGAFPVQNRFPVQMRVAPNVTTYTSNTRANPGKVLVNGATASTGFSQGSDTISHATWNNGALTNVGDYYAYYMDATAEL